MGGMLIYIHHKFLCSMNLIVNLPRLLMSNLRVQPNLKPHLKNHRLKVGNLNSRGFKTDAKQQSSSPPKPARQIDTTFK